MICGYSKTSPASRLARPGGDAQTMERPRPVKQARPSNLQSITPVDRDPGEYSVRIMPLSIGDRVGEYQVETVLGAGGMGQVYGVRHGISDRLEALKAILPNQEGWDSEEERFLREIRLLAGINHPNIARLHTAFRDQGRLFMVMELVSGTTLKAILAGGPLPTAKALAYIGQILLALEYAHGLGIIHRDIKPANVMIEPAGQVKLLDFGLAYQRHGVEITRTRSILGTLQYMSPEQILGHSTDARSDLYSLGVTMYQALTNHLPFHHKSEFALAKMHLEQLPIDPRTVNRQLSEPLAQVVLKLLSKSPADRFRSAREVLDTLKHLPGAAAELPPGPQPSTNPDHVATTGHGHLHGHLQDLDTQSAAYAPDAQSVAELTRILAHSIGPIAGRIIAATLARAKNQKHLHQLLASEIDDVRERNLFLKAVGANDSRRRI